MNWDMSRSARNFRTASTCRWKMPMKNGNFKIFPVRNCADAECWWYAAMRSATPCPLKSVQPKSEILSVRRWKVWQNQESDEHDGLWFQRGIFPAGDWFCKHSVWISNAFWGEPQPPASSRPSNIERGEKTESETICCICGKRQNTGQPAPERGELCPRRFWSDKGHRLGQRGFWEALRGRLPGISFPQG
mgnify:CR=1 FL=1